MPTPAGGAMGNEEREPDLQLGESEIAASWPVAQLDAAARERLLDHAAEVVDFAAIQGVFDATAPRLDDLARARLLRTSRNIPKKQQSWPWQHALIATAATLLAVVAAGQFPQLPMAAAPENPSATIAAAAAPRLNDAVVPPLAAAALDEPAELAAILPGLNDLGDGEELAADDGDDTDPDLGAGLDALHGVETEGGADFEAI